MLSTNIDLVRLTFDIVQLDLTHPIYNHDLTHPTTDKKTAKVVWHWEPIPAHNKFGGLLAVRPCYSMYSQRSGRVDISFQCGDLHNKVS